MKSQSWPEGGIKVPWIKPEGSELRITGRRLDADAPPLSASVPDGYRGHFQATGLIFPTEGCWQVEAEADGSSLQFVVPVERRAHLVYVLDQHNGAGSTQVLVVDPDARQVVHTIAAAYDPQIVLSPDGRRLYLTDTHPTPGRSERAVDMLSVIETGTWRTLSQVESPDRIKHKTFGRDAMFFGPDGERLFIHKWRVLDGRYQRGMGSVPRSDHWWDIFDPATGRFLPDPPYVANCGIAQPLPQPNDPVLALLCFQRSELVFLDLAMGQTLREVAIRGAFRDWVVHGNPVYAARSPDGRDIYVVTHHGQVLVVDPDTGFIDQGIDLGLTNDRRVLYGRAALSPNGNRLYIVTVRTANEDDPQLLVVDTATWRHEATAELDARVSALAFSPDGTRLYAVAPYDQTLLILDVDGQEIGRMTSLGETPSLPVVAPAP